MTDSEPATNNTLSPADTRGADGQSSRKSKKANRFELGLAILSRHARRGHCVSLETMAAYAGCTKQYIRILERRALRKIRRRCEELLSVEAGDTEHFRPH